MHPVSVNVTVAIQKAHARTVPHVWGMYSPSNWFPLLFGLYIMWASTHLGHLFLLCTHVKRVWMDGFIHPQCIDVWVLFKNYYYIIFWGLLIIFCVYGLLGSCLWSCPSTDQAKKKLHYCIMFQVICKFTSASGHSKYLNCSSHCHNQWFI